MKTISEEDKYQQILDKQNRLEMINKPTRIEPYMENQPEDVSYIGNKARNPYSNTYNLGWKDHPNLKWGSNQGGGNQVQNRLNPPYQLPHMKRMQEISMGY